MLLMIRLILLLLLCYIYLPTIRFVYVKNRSEFGVGFLLLNIERIKSGPDTSFRIGKD
jgi:hypothetical protein